MCIGPSMPRRNGCERRRGLLPALERMEERRLLATLMVTNNSGLATTAGSLPYQVAQSAAGDTIDFSITGGVQTIPLAQTLVVGHALTIDGTTQSPGSHGVVVTAGAGVTTGFDLTAAGVTLSGLVIGGFSGYGVHIETAGHDTVIGSYIGTDATGTSASANGTGIFVDDVGMNSIGGTTAGAGDLISGNASDGLLIRGAAATGNVVVGDEIGTTATGLAALPNSGDAGVQIGAGAVGNTIGGTAAGARDVISGNVGDGVLITGTASGTMVQGDYIGVDITGVKGLANAINGVEIATGGNTVGGAVAGDANLISGNGIDGVLVTGLGANNNLIQGNTIGLDATGMSKLFNPGNGVEIADGAIRNTVGGVAAGDRNVISGNGPNGSSNGHAGDGVLMTGLGTVNNLIQGNAIGVDASGTHAEGNQGNAGVEVSGGAGGETIGGAMPGAQNLINSNGTDGVLLTGGGNMVVGNAISGNQNGVEIAASSGNAITGNMIDDNFFDGVVIRSGARDNAIGGTETGAANAISGNHRDGVRITDLLTMSNAIRDDLITASGRDGIRISAGAGGNTATGNTITGNGFGLYDYGAGVAIDTGASANTIGGTDGLATRDVISGNAEEGVRITDLGTSGNVVEGDSIGTDGAGTAAMPNLGDAGVAILSGAAGNTIGGAIVGARDVISGNAHEGVLIYDASNNVVAGDLIGLGSDGNSLPNQGAGVFILADVSGPTVNNTIGGTTAGAADVISGNAGDGVLIVGAGATGNPVEGDFIGTDATGTFPRPNTQGDGVEVAAGAGNNTIGGATAGAANAIKFNAGDGVRIDSGANQDKVSRNTIAGNALDGVRITGPGSQAYVSNNMIGLAGLGNRGDAGVAVEGSAGGNVIGIGNVISGNAGDGVRLAGVSGNSVVDNTISGNALDGVLILGGSGNGVAGNRIGIGTDVAGAVALPNQGAGVHVESSGNLIGGAVPEARNVISGNVGDGVLIDGAGSTGNLVESNLIGMNAAGTAALPNQSNGVEVGASASNNTIGGTAAGAGNTIAGNARYGVRLDTRAGGNFIFGDAISGNGGVGGFDGVRIDSGANHNVVGGTALGAGNVIGANAGDGVRIAGPGTTFNNVAGNSIGTDSGGTALLGNAGAAGVELADSASNNDIGPGNTIAGNGLTSRSSGDGVLIDGGANNNSVQRNRIGFILTGSASTAVPNRGAGVLILAGSTFNAVLTDTISGNLGDGVLIVGTDTFVSGNYIGTDASGTRKLPNRSDGVEIAPPGSVAGNPGNAVAGNVIAGNKGHGVRLDAGATGSAITGNVIGVDNTGAAALGNGGAGVLVMGAGNTIGGAGVGAGNLISGNGRDGVQITGPAATRDVVAGNIIGLDRAGARALGNANNGVEVDAAGNAIGGADPGARNVISDNGYDGVLITGSGSKGNSVAGDTINGNTFAGVAVVAEAAGNTVTGDAIAGNILGVLIESGAHDNTIGGTSAGARDLITGNTAGGVLITGGGTVRNLIIGDTISGNRGVAGVRIGGQSGPNLVSGDAITSNAGSGSGSIWRPAAPSSAARRPGSGTPSRPTPSTASRSTMFRGIPRWATTSASARRGRS